MSGEFSVIKKAVQSQFEKMTRGNTKLFVSSVDKDKLWEMYLSSFPEGTNEIYNKRLEYDCSCCRQFIRNVGNVVSIDENNNLISIWDNFEISFPFDVVSKKMSELVKSFPIENIYFSQESAIGTDKNRQLLPDGKVKTWEHFYLKIPAQYMLKGSKSLESVQGGFRDCKNVFKRSLSELTTDAAETILELIEQDSIYRGTEFKEVIKTFITYKKEFDKIKDENKKDNWCWKNSIDNHVSKIRNTAIGTLLIDLSENVEVDTAVRKFESVVAPSNYNRPKALITKGMIEQAQKKIVELGYEESLGRRHAVTEDITVNNVLFVNRDTKKKMNKSVFDDLKETVTDAKPKNFSKVEEVTIEDFIKNILPTTNNIELLVESNHKSNLMSLIAPMDIASKTMFKWNNNFSWTYAGETADSMKERVKSLGGAVDGVLRFSIQWNFQKDNNNDYDAHCIEPNGNEIYFRNKLDFSTKGILDTDIRAPKDEINNETAVENITWPDKSKMLNGKYVFFVHNWCHRGGTQGFKAEIEYNGQIYHFNYDKDIRNDERVIVAEIEFDKSKPELKFIKSLDSTKSSEEVWSINTNKFVKVNMMMFSPNYWDEQKGISNKHYFFILEGCKNPDNPRGFFNEFLKSELLEHKRVFEVLGGKMKVEYSDDQLSGVGFSSTQRNSVIAKIEGKVNRTIKINF